MLPTNIYRKNHLYASLIDNTATKNLWWPVHSVLMEKLYNPSLTKIYLVENSIKRKVWTDYAEYAEYAADEN